MPIAGTIQVTGQIAPTSTSDTYPTHDAQYGRGGIHHAADLAERDSIPTARRVAGMLCSVESDGKIYRLGLDLSTWTELVTGGAGSTAELVCGGSALGGHRVLTVDNSGLAIYADCTISAHVGRPLFFTTQAVNAAELFKANLSGIITEPGWSWTPGQSLWLGTAGQLVTYAGLPSVREFDLQVAAAVTPTSIQLSLTAPQLVLA